MKTYLQEAIELLQKLISLESFSKTEEKTAALIEEFFKIHKVEAFRFLNNVWVKNKYFDNTKPVILLNSHHDTVKPNSLYTKNPFEAKIEDDLLYGLGSNDAGGALVSLMATFLHFYERNDLNFNLIFAASAEEEISGKNGIETLLPQLGKIDFGIVGEPTLLNMAIAEKGLLVVDCITTGIAGHAAREEGLNAIYLALQDIEWFKNYKFSEKSETLGEVKMTVTLIQAGTQHNVVPETCSFTVDIRTTDKYSNEKILELIRQHVSSKVNPRSLRLNSSFIHKDHPVVKAGLKMGLSFYGSPTLSDQALMNFPTIKMGPGDSARSHTADEFIYLKEIEDGIETYIKLLKTYNSIL